jgi:VCBS repeat-containing protein
LVDTDVDGNPLTATLLTSPVNGGLTLNANGSFTYTPNTNFNGTDSFTYLINDGSLTSNTATVTLTINSLNDAPVATNDAFSTEQNQPLTIAVANLLTNDTDIENNPLTVTGVSNAVNGTVSLVNGQITFTPNSTFSGNASFQYAISDGQGGTDNATVNITVNPPAGSPGSLSFSTANYSVAENGTATVNIFRSNGTTGAISATLLLSDGTATAPSDFNGSPITVSFANREPSKTVIIPIIDDSILESTETINLSLSNPSNGATIGSQNTATVNIIDNDFKPTLTVNITAEQVIEGNTIQGISPAIQRLQILSRCLWLIVIMPS